MKISIIIPCYNEEKTIVKIVEKINALINLDKEIILVDDGSNDGTVDIIKKKVQKNVDHVVYHEKNSGKGSAIQSGLKYVTGDIIIIQDADLEYEPKDYERLIHPILNNEFLVVYGSRVLGIRQLSGNHFISQIRVFANYILTLLSNLINNQNLKVHILFLKTSPLRLLLLYLQNKYYSMVSSNDLSHRLFDFVLDKHFLKLLNLYAQQLQCLYLVVILYLKPCSFYRHTHNHFLKKGFL